MKEVLVISSDEFPKLRGKAQTKLGNLVADLSLEIANQLYKPIDLDSIDFCLLNFGGLRTSLPKGEITRGKIFELMPFENELVVVTINQKNYNKFLEYIAKSGGQPIAGIQFGHNKYPFKRDGLLIKEPDILKILTTDYLANGGDKMNFFLNPIKTEPVGIKLRDAIIQYCISENKKGNQLVGKLDNRLIVHE
jgi:5'-nucleotidase